MKKINKTKGFTLIEALIYVSISAGFFATVYQIDSNFDDKIKYNTLSNNVSDIMEGFDQRLAIDGFKGDLWSQENWKNLDEVSSNLINKQLRPKDTYSIRPLLMKAGGCEGDWIPKNEIDAKSNLVQCNMWKNKTPLDLDVEAEITKDSNDFVEAFQLLFTFKDKEHFQDDFLLLKKTYHKLNDKDSNGLTGDIQYEFVDSSDTENRISISQCIKLEEDCAFVAKFDRDGGRDELRVDGMNYMINSSINFSEVYDGSPLQCVKWTKNDSDVWNKNLEENCGIGIYPETNTPVIVETIGENGTYESVALRDSCNVFNWDTVTNSLVVLNSDETPCGMTEEGDEIYQVIDNIKATNGYVENFYAKDINIEILNAENIISKNINTDFLTIENNLFSNYEAYLKDLDGNYINFKDKINLKGILSVDGKTTIHQDVDLNHKLTTDSMIIGGDSTITTFTGDSLDADFILSHQNLKSGIVKFSDSVVSGSNCSDNNSIGKNSNGVILNCKDGKWSTVSEKIPVGTVTAWTSHSIPSGWLKCEGNTIPSSYTELRSMVGSKTPDLRGQFIRGLDNGAGRDENRSRTIRSWQSEEIEAHSHSEKQFNGSDDSGSGGKDAADDNTATSNTGYAGIETRPKNYSVIYIIKAQ